MKVQYGPRVLGAYSIFYIVVVTPNQTFTKYLPNHPSLNLFYTYNNTTMYGILLSGTAAVDLTVRQVGRRVGSRVLVVNITEKKLQFVLHA